MAIYEFGENRINLVEETTFSRIGLSERQGLQRLLRDYVEVIAPDTLVVAEEFGDWEDSRRRIDLLAIDKDANVVVIELKRTEDGGHMELQAVRYASMVSTMTFDQAVDVFSRHLTLLGKEDHDSRVTLLDFLGWDEPDEDQFAQNVRIVLASAEFSKELTSSVLWLSNFGIDIRCVRLKPYNFDGRLLVDVQQIVPLPEAADYQFQVREKARKERQARVSSADFTRFDVRIGVETFPAMWKRQAVFLVCKRLCDGGVAPEELAALFEWRSNRVWYAVDGNVDAAQFDRLAAEKAASGGPRYDPGRWFREESELVRVNGKTYAFSKMWGGEYWHKAMELLKNKYPQFGIEFSPTS